MDEPTNVRTCSSVCGSSYYGTYLAFLWRRKLFFNILFREEILYVPSVELEVCTQTVPFYQSRPLRTLCELRICLRVPQRLLPYETLSVGHKVTRSCHVHINTYVSRPPCCAAAFQEISICRKKSVFATSIRSFCWCVVLPCSQLQLTFLPQTFTRVLFEFCHANSHFHRSFSGNSPSL